MSAADQTGTLWVILMTPQKKMLAKISSLKRYGKLKIDELKIMYGRKGMGGWIFQVLGQPKSRTFSFHDGEVILRSDQGYLPLRKHGARIYFVLLILVLVWMSGMTLHRFFSMSEEVVPIEIAKPEIMPQPKLPNVAPKKTEKAARIVDPRSHEYFLQAKRDFQYGKMTSSMKILKENMAAFSDEDQKEATQMISEVFYLQCQQFRSKHEERKAVIACEKALAYGVHPKAEVYLNAQEEKARQYYLEGYTVVKFNPVVAKQKFSLVLQSSKTQSTWRNKAQYQLRKFKKQDA
jgi:hypothetical protein